MCGIAGFFSSSSKLSNNEYSKFIDLMIRTLVHRGPDNTGAWVDKNNNIGLGHTRLAIQDLSAAGNQPMVSPSQRYVVAFNGEIYNHLPIRSKLEKICDDVNWRGHSDTETLLCGFDVWGIQETIERVVGMFAFAVWDKKENVLILGRDRIGEKPLYYGWQDNVFLFGSELKALKAHPEFIADINRNAIALMLRHNCIPAPYSIYQGIYKLEPGCLLKVSSSRPTPEITNYWSVSHVVEAGVQKPFTGTPDEAVDELEQRLKDSIRQQMIADVQLGAFLSGGVDSSVVVALMQELSSRPVKTFSIGFHDNEYNEAEHGKSVAQHLSTEHVELYVTPEQAMAVIPRLPTLFCEPFSDSSQIPTYLVSQLAKQHVTVSLSGDAGDELFCGYNRYQLTNKLWKKLNMLPPSVKSAVAKGITMFSPERWNTFNKYIPGAQRYINLGDKLHKGAGVMTCRTVSELYKGLVSHHSDPAALVIGAQEPATLLTGNLPELIGLNDVQRMMALDLLTYLPDDILVKVDRAAMGVSLETRIPFLDHRIVEFAWTLPQSIKLRDNETKWPLRQLLYRHVPKELVDRPKMGFGVPLHDWLRGPLRDWAESLLDENRLIHEGIFYPAPIRELWSEHLSGRRNWAYHLWDILMFQSWFEAQ